MESVTLGKVKKNAMKMKTGEGEIPEVQGESPGMRSSKLESIFNYKQPAEDAKTLSPFTYYQPFQSSFDPGFSADPPKAGVVGPPSVGGRWGQGGAFPRESGAFVPRPPLGPSLGKGPPPEAAASAPWGEAEGRSLCNSTWRSPAPPLRPSFSGYGEGQGLKGGLRGAGGSGLHSQFPPKGDAGLGGICRPQPGFGGLGEGASFRTGGSPLQGPIQGGSFDGGLAPPSYYPLMLSPLGKSTNQNAFRSGHSRPMMCNFCKNNKEVPDIYLNHYLYDPETKVLSCPVLRKHVCEICGGTGDQAHTLQYCPVNRERGLQSKVPVLLKTRTITNSTGKIRRN